MKHIFERLLGEASTLDLEAIQHHLENNFLFTDFEKILLDIIKEELHDRGDSTNE